MFHDNLKTIHHDSLHRFSTKKKSHSWCDFTPSFTVFDSKLGFLSQNDSVLIIANILILHESEDAGPSILFVYSLHSIPDLKPHISVELSWSLVREKGVMCGNCFVCWENYERVKKSCLVTRKVTVVWLVELCS